MKCSTLLILLIGTARAITTKIVYRRTSRLILHKMFYKSLSKIIRYKISLSVTRSCYTTTVEVADKWNEEQNSTIVNQWYKSRYAR